MKTIITTLNSKFIHSSLSIRYLKSFCEKHLEEIDIEEYTINQNNDYITRDIYKKKADIVAFSCYIWNIEEVLDISNRLKIVNPNLIIILGGPEVSYDGVRILKDNSFIDYIVYGEGEETFKELLTKLYNHDNKLDSVDGIIYRNVNEIIKTSPRIPLNNLDIIPTPFEGDTTEYENKIVYYESSRGCPFDCQFCLSSTVKGIRFFSIERVKNDLKKLIDSKVKQVKFVDRTFNANKKYAMEIMEFISNQNVTETNFHFEVTAHLVDEEMLEFLKTAPEGLFQFEIGVQSTNDNTLKEIHRTTDFEKLSYVVNKIKSFNNIHQHLDLIVGLPFENYESFKKSFNDVYNLEPDKLQLGFLKLLKGSGLRMNKERHGYKFVNRPTYEVLENDYIKYNEILKLKSIEEVVEKFGNEKDFKLSTKYIINNYFESSFDFYEKLSQYFDIKEYHKISHSKKKLYKILFDFYRENINIKIDIFNELIKFDYIYNNNSKVPDFIERKDTDILLKQRHDFLKDDNNISKYIPSHKNRSVKKVINDIHFEKFSIDILNFIENGYKLNESSNVYLEKVLLFEYNKNTLVVENSKVFDVTKYFNE